MSLMFTFAPLFVSTNFTEEKAGSFIGIVSPLNKLFLYAFKLSNSVFVLATGILPHSRKFTITPTSVNSVCANIVAYLTISGYILFLIAVLSISTTDFPISNILEYTGECTEKALYSS